MKEELKFSISSRNWSIKNWLKIFQLALVVTSHYALLWQSNPRGLGSTPNLVVFCIICVQIVSNACFEINFSDWWHGLAVSSIICDNWWHLLVVLKIIEAGPVLKSSIAVVQWQPWEGQEDPIPAQAKKRLEYRSLHAEGRIQRC